MSNSDSFFINYSLLTKLSECSSGFFQRNIPKIQSEVKDVMARDVGSISNPGGTTLRGHFFLKKKGAFSRSKKGISLSIAKSWKGMCPQCPPVPTSICDHECQDTSYLDSVV